MQRLGQIALKFSLFICLLLLIWSAGNIFQIDAHKLAVSLEKFSLLKAALVFLLFYILAGTIAWMAKDILRVAAALLFGAYLSTCLIWLGECINAFILFYFSRYLGREFVQSSIPANLARKWQARFLNNSAFMSLLVLRALPLVPFRFMDILAGLSPLRFKKYLLVVFFGSPLRIFWIQYIISAVGSSIFKNPLALGEYFLANPWIFGASLIYLVSMLLVAFRLGGGK